MQQDDAASAPRRLPAAKSDIALNRLFAAPSSALAPTEHPNPTSKARATADVVVAEIRAYFPAKLVI